MSEEENWSELMEIRIGIEWGKREDSAKDIPIL